MKSFYLLFLQEIHRLKRHASSYFIAALFLFIMGFNFLYILFLNAQNPTTTPCLQSFFEIFWIPSLFIIPLLTMRTLSEDQRSGILESLLSTPIGTRSLVLSKVFSVYCFYLLLWGLNLIYPFFADYHLQGDLSAPLIQSTPLIGGLTFICSSSFLFICIGVFASSLTRTQSLAGFLCFCFLFIGLVCIKIFCEIGYLENDLGIYMDCFQQLDDLCKGSLDIRPLLFHIGGGLLFFILTTTVLENKLLR